MVVLLNYNYLWVKRDPFNPYKVTQISAIAFKTGQSLHGVNGYAMYPDDLKRGSSCGGDYVSLLYKRAKVTKTKQVTTPNNPVINIVFKTVNYYVTNVTINY